MRCRRCASTGAASPGRWYSAGQMAGKPRRWQKWRFGARRNARTGIRMPCRLNNVVTLLTACSIIEQVVRRRRRRRTAVYSARMNEGRSKYRAGMPTAYTVTANGATGKQGMLFSCGRGTTTGTGGCCKRVRGSGIHKQPRLECENMGVAVRVGSVAKQMAPLQ